MGLLFNKKILTSEDLSVISSRVGKTEWSDEWGGDTLGGGGVVWYDLHRTEDMKPIMSKLLENIPGEVTYYGTHAVEYISGSYIKPHIDTFEWTLVTLLDGEWEGGEFMIEDSIVDFPIGNTICYEKETLHGVLPVEKGKRTVFVTFVNKLEEYEDVIPQNEYRRAPPK